MHEVEAARLVCDIAVRVVGEPGDAGFEPIQWPMEQPIPHGFDLETTLGFLLHPLVEAGENGDKAVRLGHVGR